MSNTKLNSRYLPSLLLRFSSILFVGLMLGHMSAFPWASRHSVNDAKLIDLMKSLTFEFMGEHSTYWNLYFGWGLLVGVLLLTMAIILWFLADLARSNPRNVGIISGAISITNLMGAFLSFRYFFIPPFVFFSVLCLILMTTSIQLMKLQNE